MKLRYLILWLVAIAVLGLVNISIIQKENLIEQGQVIFLELAPVDPRSLIQGDYMALRYAIGRDLERRDDLPSDGYLVLKVTDNNIAHFERLDDGQTPLAGDELLLRYRRRGWSLRLGAESFFFQEGQAEDYQNAKYAELRVDAAGESVLVDLRGPNLEPLGPPE